MSHRKRIEIKLEAIKLAEMLESYQRIYMQNGNEELRKTKEKEFDDRRADFEIQYGMDFVEALPKRQAMR
ncbi:MAG: hypothetical protein ACK6DA_01205 [Candidatus Kapaibacterium sp.]